MGRIALAFVGLSGDHQSPQNSEGEIRPDDYPATDKLDKSVLIVAGVVVLGAIMSILDITVVSVALQTFQTEFNATVRRRSRGR